MARKRRSTTRRRRSSVVGRMTPVRARMSSTRRRKNPSKRRATSRSRSALSRRRSSVARRRRNPTINYKRVAWQGAGVLAGTLGMGWVNDQADKLLSNLDLDPKMMGGVKILAGLGIIALGDYIQSMPEISRSQMAAAIPFASAVLATTMVHDGYQAIMGNGMSGSRRRMRGTIVRSPMLANQLTMGGTRMLGPGMQGSLEVYGSPQASIAQMQGTYGAQCI